MSFYGSAAERAKKILPKFDFTAKQVRKIKQHIKSNTLIHETKEARESILGVIDKYSAYFDDKFKYWAWRGGRSQLVNLLQNG